jgi:hypothetical protein
MIKSQHVCFLAGMLLVHAATASPKPVEFDFIAPDNPSVQNPFARELWVEIVTPGGQHLELPAYYADAGLYSVRARPDQLGTYHFGAVHETTMGVRKTGLVVSLVTPGDVQNTSRTRLPSIIIDPKDPKKFARSDGLPYLPVGANLAWSADGVSDRVGYYLGALPSFSKANLNWMRIWMAHWDALNLDWLPSDMGQSPRPGTVNSEVADNWDRILASAE